MRNWAAHPHHEFRGVFPGYIGVQALIKDKNSFLLNFYGPNNNYQAVQFYDNLIDVLRKEGLTYERKIIIGGDFNCPINPLLQSRTKGRGTNVASPPINY